MKRSWNIFLICCASLVVVMGAFSFFTLISETKENGQAWRQSSVYNSILEVKRLENLEEIKLGVTDLRAEFKEKQQKSSWVHR